MNDSVLPRFEWCRKVAVSSTAGGARRGAMTQALVGMGVKVALFEVNLETATSMVKPGKG